MGDVQLHSRFKSWAYLPALLRFILVCTLLTKPYLYYAVHLLLVLLTTARRHCSLSGTVEKENHHSADPSKDGSRSWRRRRVSEICFLYAPTPFSTNGSHSIGLKNTRSACRCISVISRALRVRAMLVIPYKCLLLKYDKEHNFFPVLQGVKFPVQWIIPSSIV